MLQEPNNDTSQVIECVPSIYPIGIQISNRLSCFTGTLKYRFCYLPPPSANNHPRCHKHIKMTKISGNSVPNKYISSMQQRWTTVQHMILATLCNQEFTVTAWQSLPRRQVSNYPLLGVDINRLTVALHRLTININIIKTTIHVGVNNIKWNQNISTTQLFILVGLTCQKFPNSSTFMPFIIPPCYGF